MRLARHIMLTASASTLLAASSAFAAAPLIPHRAVYDLNLSKASDRSGITGISGRMVYEFNGSKCEGYSVKFRFVTQIDTSEQSRVTDQQTTTYEDGKGDMFTFVTKSFVDQALDKEVKGTATREAQATDVAIEKPEAGALKLARTQFPTQHLMELIAKAESGEKFYETTLFDGSEDANEVLTTTVIIGKEEPTAETDPEQPALANFRKDDPYWPVNIAYFDSKSDDAGEEVPTYNISFKLHENGVTRDLTMDYGDFSMTGKLVELQTFPESRQTCD